MGTFLRRAAASRIISGVSRHRLFQSSACARVQVGDELPAIKLVENSPGNTVDVREEIAKTGLGKGLIIGVPAAFSPGCSNSHIPGYLNHPKLKDAGAVFVVAVNDPFVTKAWAQQMDPDGRSGVRFLGDPTAKWTEGLDLHFNGAAIFGGMRSKRYALKIEDGKVQEAFVEPDNTGIDVSDAKKVLG